MAAKKFHLKNFDVEHLRVLHEAALKREAAVRAIANARNPAIL